MTYKFAVENLNYQDYSSGRVFYNQNGTTSFPVRLSSEIFSRCLHILREKGINKLVNLYDPCCGGAYMLTSIGFLHGENIAVMHASDIDEKALQLAEKNLELLTLEGLESRRKQIEKMFQEFQKTSHKEALESAARLKEILLSRKEVIETRCFVSDATNDKCEENVIADIDMVITDLPYGEIVAWSNEQEEGEAVSKLLENLQKKLKPTVVIAIVSRKKTKILHENYRRVEYFNLGKRKITIIELIN